MVPKKKKQSTLVWNCDYDKVRKSWSGMNDRVNQEVKCSGMTAQVFEQTRTWERSSFSPLQHWRVHGAEITTMYGHGLSRPELRSNIIHSNHE